MTRRFQSIASDVVVGTADATDGDIRVGETYGSDQFSQVEVTGTQLSGGQWIGASVRSQNSGQNLYLGIYFWNNGDPQLRLYKRSAGAFTQLGSSFESGALPAGTQLRVSAVGSQISLSENGTVRIAASDSTLTGGAPGIMTFGAAACACVTGAAMRMATTKFLRNRQRDKNMRFTNPYRHDAPPCVHQAERAPLHPGWTAGGPAPAGAGGRADCARGSFVGNSEDSPCSPV